MHGTDRMYWYCSRLVVVAPIFLLYIRYKSFTCKPSAHATTGVSLSGSKKHQLSAAGKRSRERREREKIGHECGIRKRRREGRIINYKRKRRIFCFEVCWSARYFHLLLELLTVAAATSHCLCNSHFRAPHPHRARLWESTEICIEAASFWFSFIDCISFYMGRSGA